MPALFIFFLILFSWAPCMAKDGILLVAFGTSVPEARPALESLEAAYKKAYPDTPIVWAFTSSIIRKKLAKQGIHVGSIGDGLDTLAKEGVNVVRVQSLHIMPGEEFTALERSLLVHIQRHPGRFEAVLLGRPLLESDRDAHEAATAIRAMASAFRKEGDVLVLMGHGQKDGRADLVFEGARAIFRKDDPLVYMATVEGSRDFPQMLAEMEKGEMGNVWLMPMMVVAGDHARNDLAGSDDDSWASQLAKRGYKVAALLSGLGENPGIAEIFLRHTREAADNLVEEPKKP